MWHDNGDRSIHSPYWAYNQPGWKPYCVRCHKRKDDCKKYNSNELGSFVGEWICTSCVAESDYKTPCQQLLDRPINEVFPNYEEFLKKWTEK